MDKHVTEKKEYNKGFSLFTVIVSIAFVGILGMLVLYIAIANFHMKITDLKGKDSFYTAERAIEEIRVGLQEEVGDAMSEAYIEVLETYDQSGKSQNDVQDEIRQKAFRQSFYDNLYVKVQKKLGHLQEDYVDLTVGDNETLEIVEPTLSEKLNRDEIKKSSKVSLKNLKAVYVDEKGRASIIKTDIQMGIPNVKFATPSSLPDLMGMVVVANSGIICEGDPNKDIKLTGNIYAGLLNDSEEGFPKDKDTSLLVKNNANLSIISADKFVCAGDINLVARSSFTSNAGVELWAKGLTVNSSMANLLGDTYFANDLTVASGNGSAITIAGNYYGYGSAESAKKSHYEERYKNYKDTDLNSAIIVNGKATKLDLSGVQKLMLAGKSYISDPSKTSDVMTGESVTVKGTQLAYLASAKILGDDSADSSNYTNPMTYDEAVTNGLEGNTIPVKWDTPVETWGGKTLRDIGVDSKTPIKKVFYSDNASGTVVYYYLNFTDETNASKFMSEYYQKNPDIKKQMDKYLSFYFNGEDSGIYVKDSETYLLYVTNGNILSYSGKDKEGKLYSATHPKLTNKLIQDQIDYQDEWFALNRKMVSNYNDLDTSVSDPDDKTTSPHNETDPSSTVFDNLVNEKKLKEFVKNETEQKYQYPKGGSHSVIMCNNGSQGTNKTLQITSKEAESVRLVVCTGDVEIAKDVQFRGIIMAKGKITVNPGVQLEAAPLEAAKVFQAQIEDENSNGQTLKAQDFFWHGKEYVLGNTTDNSQNTEEESTTYNLADCVTYSNWKKE